MKKLWRRLVCRLLGCVFPVSVLPREDAWGNLYYMMNPKMGVHCSRCERRTWARARVEYMDGLDYLVIRVE